MAALLFEVTLTRVFAVMMWYHFAYLVVSLALLGFGASGSLLTAIRAGERRDAVWNRLALFSTGFGVAIILSFLLTTRIPVDTLMLWKNPGNLLGLMLCFAILSIPFVLAGLAIGSGISWFPRTVGTIYCFDLVGSAVGGFSAPWLLSRLRTDAVVIVAALIAVVAGAIFGFGANRRRGFAHSVPLVIVLILVVGFAGGGWNIPPLKWHIPFARHKIFAELFFPKGESAKTLPSATAQVDVSAPMSSWMLMAGDFGAQEKQVVNLRGVTQDGSAPTALYENAGNFERFRSFMSAQAATAFLANASLGNKQPDVLVIGVGGGVDVMMSLFFGARSVTAVDINTAMVKMVTQDYADYIGRLFSNPKVHLLNEDGRSYLNRTHESYDVIQLSGVDTYTALSTGAYTLSENYLYTVEAVMEMYSHLKNGGYINYSRLILTKSPERPPRETLRLSNIVRAALARMGVADPWQNIAVFQGETWASTIIRKGPFTETEIRTLRNFAQREKFLGFIFDPFSRNGALAENADEPVLTATPAGITAPVSAEAREAVRQLFESSLRAAFHGDAERSNGWITLAAMTLSESEGERAKLVERFRAQRDGALAEARRQLEYRRQASEYFERVLRGSEQQRELFVDNYYYDLRPPWDDKPFFFDYFKLRRIFAAPPNVKWSTGSEALPEFPVGHIILISSLGQIAILAVIMILLPLRTLSKAGYTARGKFRYFVYFAALGCGFMFAEISLIQRLTLFLGHPTYSLSVVLTSILAFSGLGALASSRLTIVSRPLMLVLLAAVVGLLILDGFGVPWVVKQAIGLGKHYRIAIACLILAPTAFALGFPFPLGIRLLEREAPVLIPWGLAINGFLSVAGSLLAIMLAMSLGFSAVLLAGAAIYAIGFLAIPVPRYDRESRDA